MSTAEYHVHDDVLEVFAPDMVIGPDVDELFRRLDELRERYARPFLLVRNGGPTMSTEARKAITTWFRSTTLPIECAAYGGGMVQRVVIDMLRRAVDLLTPGRLWLVTYKTRDEAIAGIDERRRLPPPGQ